jgi:hypothetical protein
MPTSETRSWLEESERGVQPSSLKRLLPKLKRYMVRTLRCILTTAGLLKTKVTGSWHK